MTGPVLVLGRSSIGLLLPMLLGLACGNGDLNTLSLTADASVSDDAGNDADAGVSVDSGSGSQQPIHCLNTTFDPDEGETDVDCGGPCRACPFGLECLADGDCASGLACGDDGICDRQACEDGALNGLETDVDCGGSECFTRCNTDQGCSVTSDCDQARCAQGQCEPSTCVDSILNGTETDVDCGGDLCDPCELGEICLERRDCIADIEVSTACRSDVACSVDGLQDVRFETYDCSQRNRCVRTEQGTLTDVACQRDLTPFEILPDVPDLGNTDNNCDGIDGVLARSILVSEATGSDANDGRGRIVDGQLEADPVRTLRRAIDLASACVPEPCAVLIAEGTYPQDAPLRLASGVDLYGGYTLDWQHTLPAVHVQITGLVSPAVVADRIRAETVMADVTIRGADVTSPVGAESIALLVTSSTIADRALVVRRSQIDGGRGAAGQSGGNGQRLGSRRGGGGGGSSFNCGSNRGGRGGGGNGGAGGAGGSNVCVNVCPAPGRGGISNGGTGRPGRTGGNGRRGAASTNTRGSFVGTDWLPTAGANGGSGAAGGGGGGGGGGGTKKMGNCFGCGAILGGGGGNGGQGGRAGGGGIGGSQGGGAFGVVMIDSVMTFDGSSIRGGVGGDGGSGGNGGDGEAGTGGTNGGGGSSRTCGLIGYNSGSGGQGGHGGQGGGGGGGAGGNGGPAIGLVRVGTSVVGASPVFTAGTAGDGGAGGIGGRQGGQGARAGSGEAGRDGSVENEVQL